jgi:G3E family GTPase
MTEPCEENAVKKVQLVFVGGFLGAGKTTLLWRTAELLMKRGKRVGLITNDQAPDLVDTKWLAQKGLNVREVAGSCFCCSFFAMIEAAESLRSLDVDILIGEPVGSCADLSATILQPLKDKFGDRFVLSPLSVLADPLRLRDVLSDGEDALHASAEYIFRKQLEEADLVVINKMDLVSPTEKSQLQRLIAARIPRAAVRYLSARTGEGLESWLDEVLSSPAAGSHVLDMDYDTYAEGEAVLGWLNAEIRLSAAGASVEWRTFCSDLLKTLRATFRERRANVGHVKLLLTAGGGHCMGNLTSRDGEPLLQGEIDGSPTQASLTLNARVEMLPEDLERIARDTLSKTASDHIRTEILTLHCLRPGRPRPTHRYKVVIE